MGVAEIIMDMAPGMDLYLAVLDDTMLPTLHEVVDWLIAQNVDVISMSLRYAFEGPGDGTSLVKNSALSAIDKAVNAGIVWVNSAGNYGDRQTWSTLDVQNVTVTTVGACGSGQTTTWLDFDPGSDIDTHNRVHSSAGSGNTFTTFVELRWSGGGELHLFRTM